MKTTIVIEDGRVSIQVDDGEPVEVNPGDVVIPIMGKAHAGPDVSAKPVSDTPRPPRTTAVTPKEPTPTGNCLNCGDPVVRNAKYCKKPECKKAQTKANNDRYRLARGVNVGVGRGRRKSNPAGQFEMEAKDDTPPLWKDAPPAEPVYRSNCCDAAVRVSGGEDEPDEGGTRFYVCQGCGNSCDVHELPFEDPWDCGACRANGRLCRLHHSMEAEGKTPPAVRHQL